MKAVDLMRDAGAFTPDEPTPLVRELPRGEAYPVEALGPLREAAEAIHDMTQAPPAIGAQAVLGVAALAAQALGNAETLHGPAPASLFLLTIAESGERKSACDRLAMQAVRDFEEDLRDREGGERLDYENRLAIWDAERKRILQSGRKGELPPSRVEMEADLKALGPAPEAPSHPTILAGEPTFEGLTKHMGRLRPALGLFSDEGGGFIGGYGMNADNRLKTISGFSKLWDGAPVDRWRAGDGVQVFPGRRLSAHLMVQPVAAAGLLGDPQANGQGFLARFLMVEPPSAIGHRERLGHSSRSEAAVDRFTARASELLRRPLPLRTGARNELAPPPTPLSPEARALLRDFALQVERAQAKGGDFETSRPFASKAAEHAARIAAVLTIFAGAPSVPGETMADAVTLAAFYANEASRLANTATISVETAEAERLRRWLIEGWPEAHLSVTDVVQFGPPSLRETAKVRRLLPALVANGWLAPVEDGAEIKGRRRREAWRIIRGGDR